MWGVFRGAREYADQVAVITVHGTGDGDRDVNREGQWWRPSSAFCAQLVSGLAERGVRAEVFPVLWSGQNNALEREKGAYSLAREIRARARRYGGVHIVAHSHGGNVANDGALLLDWGKGQGNSRLITSITTVGTPYLRNKLFARQLLGARIFVLAALLQLVVFPPAMLWIAVLLLPRGAEGADIGSHLMPLMGAAGAALFAAGFAWFFMLPEANRGLRRLRRAGARKRENVSIFAVRHPNDEAIEALKAVLTQNIEPFPRWAILRNAAVGGIGFGILAMVVGTVFLLTYSLTVATGILTPAAVPNWLQGFDAFWRNVIIGNQIDAIGFIIIVVLHALWLGVLFTASFTLFVSISLLVEMLGRGFLNETVSDTVRGMALGSIGDQKPAYVEDTSHAFAARPLMLDGELAERMRANAAAKTGRFVETYRWQLLMAGANHAEIIEKMKLDPETWKSLIHTTYFDQPEMAILIAQHIADAQSQRAKA